MNLNVSLIVFALLQLVVAIAEDENATTGLRGSLFDRASEEDDRKLRPYPYPAPPNRPGQSQQYGLNSLLGYRPFTNAPQPQQRPLFNQNPGFNRGFNGRFRRRGPVGPQRPQDLNGDGQIDGALVIGVPRNPDSLAERLGFIRIDPGTPNVFVQGDPSVFRDPNTAPPTVAPVPTVSPAPTTLPPTAQPTINPTHKPTEAPTHPPTNTPTLSPTKGRTPEPTNKPSRSPTSKPSKRPSKNPTKRPSRNPTKRPTNNPTPS
mmetsp:Transcript_11108/g.26687  ORF Transcript_11108/g.26687 Transcript_11108/m.26687 type:complete len:261 (-) Transcript_11108:325-1107(-)